MIKATLASEINDPGRLLIFWKSLFSSIIYLVNSYVVLYLRGSIIPTKPFKIATQDYVNRGT